MHGFNNSVTYLSKLCEKNDFIFVQEHWLLKAFLCKFDVVIKTFVFNGCSAMDSVCGRPFGGVGILYRKNLSSKLRIVGYHSESRCVAVTLSTVIYGYYV